MVIFKIEELGVLNEYAKKLPERGPYNSVQLGMLKELDQMVTALEKSSGVQVHITMLLRSRAMAALPKDTAKLLRDKMMSSQIALELVRRDMTTYSQLSSGLYSATDEDLDKDPALKRIHERLKGPTELHGALTVSGIYPGEREWAQALVDQLTTLKRLRATPWHEIALLLGLIELTPEKEQEMEDKKGKKNKKGGKDEEVSESGFKFVYDNPPTSVELRIVKELFSVGEGTPPIRAQVLSYRMDLDVADELEEMGIYDARMITQTDERRLILRAKEKLEEEEAEEAAREQAEAERLAALKANAEGKGEEATPRSTSRALPALAAVATQLGALAAGALPKLGTLSRLTSIGGSNGLSSLTKNLSAMSANSGAPPTNALSGLTSNINSATGAINATTGAVQAAKGLFNELTPDVEEQVKSIEQEKARLTASIEAAREELDKVDVTGVASENLTEAREALEKAKAEVAPDPDFGVSIAEGSGLALQQSLQDQRITFGGPVGLGSYASNEELVAKASGGAALYGMNYFPTTTDVVLKPYAPLLQSPSFVDMAGATSSFEAKVEKTTSQEKAAAFHNTSTNAGISVAQSIITTRGGSASASAGIFSKVSATASSSNTTSSSSNTTVATSTDDRATAQTSTSSATLIEYVRCPMRSFRIPVSQMEMNADAFESALEITNMEMAEAFLDSYGSHVSTGRQEVGGIFFSTITLTTEKAVSEVSMFSAASRTSESVKSASRNTTAGGGGSFLGFGAKASVSFGKATSTGIATVNESSSGAGSSEATETAQYESYVRCVGPNTATPETFAEALFTDTSTWAVTDRGRLEAMVPVTAVLERTARVAVDEPIRSKLELAILFIKAAWRRRAKRWGFLLNDDPNLEVPTAVINLLKTAYPVSQGTIPAFLKALQSSLIIRFIDDVELSPLPLDDAEEDVKKVALKIWDAAGLAEENNNNFPAELSHLDAAGVESQVKKEIAKLEAASRKNFESTYKLNLLNPDGTEKTNEQLLAELDAAWNAVENKLGDIDDTNVYDGSTGWTKAWRDLEVWQQQWITKNSEQDGVWTAADYELFQRLNFSVDQSSAFLNAITQGLRPFEPAAEPESGRLLTFTIRFSDDEELQASLRQAVSGMRKEDWITVRDLWIETSAVDTGRSEDNELGHEGANLEARIMNGLGLFKEVKDTRKAREDTDDRLALEYPLDFQSLLAPLTAEESQEIEDSEQRLRGILAKQQATVEVWQTALNTWRELDRLEDGEDIPLTLINDDEEGFVKTGETKERAKRRLETTFGDDNSATFLIDGSFTRTQLVFVKIFGIEGTDDTPGVPGVLGQAFLTALEAAKNKAFNIGLQTRIDTWTAAIPQTLALLVESRETQQTRQEEREARAAFVLREQRAIAAYDNAFPKE